MQKVRLDEWPLVSRVVYEITSNTTERFTARLSSLFQMKIFDRNKDGRLDLNDLARYMLKTKELTSTCCL